MHLTSISLECSRQVSFSDMDIEESLLWQTRFSTVSNIKAKCHLLPGSLGASLECSCLRNELKF